MNAQAGFTPHITVLGKGERRVLALHCTMAFGGAWVGFSKALPELTIVAPDMPSHGASVDWDEESNFADTVLSGAVAAMDAAPMDLIGHSFGAVTALRLAVTYPERVRSLTMIEPVFFAIAQRDAPETLIEQDVVAKPYRDALEAGDREGAARAFNGMWGLNGPTWETYPERTRAAMTRAIHVLPNTNALLFDDEAGLLGADGLSALKVPTLLVRGAHAQAAITATNDGLEVRMPNATQAVIEGAGHMAPISHPALVADAVRAFLDQF